MHRFGAIRAPILARPSNLLYPIMTLPASTQPVPNAANATPPHWLRFVLPLIVLAMSLGALGSVAYGYLAEEIRRETHRTLAVIAEQKRQRIEDWLGGIRTDAELYFAEQTQFDALYRRWVDDGRSDAALMARMSDSLAQLAHVRGWKGVVLFDAAGRSVLELGDADIGEHSAMVTDVLSLPRIELVDLHLNRHSEPEFGMLVPVGGRGGRPNGVVYISLDARAVLYPLVESWPVPTQTAETYLVRREDGGVRFLTPLRHQQQAALVLTRPLSAPNLPAAQAVQGARGIIAGGLDYREVGVLAYAAAVKGTPWLMMAEIDEREAYARIRSMAIATAVVVGLGLAMLCWGAYLLWRRNRQRQELAALNAQRAAERRFRVIFEQAPLGVALLDPASGRFTESNQRFAEIVGRSQEELVGLDPITITHPDDVAESRDRIGRLQAGEIAGYRLNKRYLRPDGEVVWISLTFAPVQVDAEEAPRFLAIAEDITARRLMEQRLQEASEAAQAANAAKSEFLAHMSHEIRTPMNAVLGLAQVLEREPLSANQRDMVERIRTAGQSLLTILNDVLDLSKIEAGQLRLEEHPFALDRLLAHVDSLMGQAARAKGLSLRIESPRPPVGMLLGDGLRVEQILFNLTGNAIKFTEQGEVVVFVHCHEADGQSLRLRFEVRDTGIGVTADALARLFTPFTQADGGIGRRFGGTGLGLSICKRLVELMGGEIGAESQPGAGSMFWFELDLRRADEAAQVPTPIQAPAIMPTGPRLQGAQVLVVDDSAMNRDLVERALRLEGAVATLAADGQQALELLRSRPQGFDAVLMDVQMPVMDGLTAMRKIRGELGLIDLPLVAFTAGVRDEQQLAARAAGADDVLPKPMDLEHLTTVLERWISRPAPMPVAPALVEPVSPRMQDVGEPIPELAGIDRDRVVLRLGEDREMFLGVLALFVDEYADAEAKTRHDLERGDRDVAARRMHTLRSSAGFLCALDVMALAEELEEAIDRGDSDLDALLAALGGDIAEIVEAAAPWLPATVSA